MQFYTTALDNAMYGQFFSVIFNRAVELCTLSLI